jgi:hypothetical protein
MRLLLLLQFQVLLLSAQTHLPPLPQWKGKSEALLQSATSKYATPFEKSNGLKSASIEEFETWFDNISINHQQISKKTIATTAEGQALNAYVFSENSSMRDSFKRSDLPLVLFQGGIHSGEIDGLDAGMLLFRDLCEGKLNEIKGKVDLVFIPVLNKDGLLRASPYNRINQRGPELQGWRSNSLNQNLNRDYTKLDSREVRAVVSLIAQLKPELYVDIHVTDGADYQYDITYGFVGKFGYSPEISHWLETNLKFQANKALLDNGHIPGPLVFLRNESKPSLGNDDYMHEPRFSNGYGGARHIPSILVENHSLKPFKQRVLGTRVWLEATLKAVINGKTELRAAIKKDENAYNAELTLDWDFPKETNDSMLFLGVETVEKMSEAAGKKITTWNALPKNEKIPVWKQNVATVKVKKPSYYIVPVNRIEVIERLKIHGVEMKFLRNDTLIDIELYRVADMKISGTAPFQGRMRNMATTEPFFSKMAFRKGSALISTQQALGDLAMLLLEPSSGDSYFQWGFFADIMERTEYFEKYAMATLADEMMISRPELKAQFDQKCQQDLDFASSADARLRWWYDHSDWADEKWLIYPVGRINQ